MPAHKFVLGQKVTLSRALAAVICFTLLTAAAACPPGKPLQALSDEELLQCWLDGKLPPQMQSEADDYVRQLERSGAIAATQDRSSLLPTIRKACENFVLSNNAFAQSMAFNRVPLEALCGCQAPLYISGLSDRQIASLRTGADLGQSFGNAAMTCLLRLRHNR
jgi:hypothetical protein